MIARARSGKVQPEDVSAAHSRRVIWALQMWDTFIAIISPPEAGILAIGSAVPTMVIRDGEPVVRSIMKVTCSADRRDRRGRSCGISQGSESQPGANRSDFYCSKPGNP